MQQAKTKNKTIAKRIKLKKFGKMYMWFFKKMNNIFFPSIFHNTVLHDILFVWINPSLICPKFHQLRQQNELSKIKGKETMWPTKNVGSKVIHVACFYLKS
jgi:hypothetical protein